MVQVLFGQQEAQAMRSAQLKLERRRRARDSFFVQRVQHCMTKVKELKLGATVPRRHQIEWRHTSSRSPLLLNAFCRFLHPQRSRG